MYQPSTQFPQVTNRESWTQLIGIYDNYTGDAVDLTGVSIQLEIRRVSGSGGGSYWDGYGPNYSVGAYDYNAPILRASIGNGIDIVDIGIIQVYFSETQFRSLGHGMHSVNATMTSA